MFGKEKKIAAKGKTEYRLGQKRNKNLQLINEPGAKGSGKKKPQQLEKRRPVD